MKRKKKKKRFPKIVPCSYSKYPSIYELQYTLFLNFRLFVNSHCITSQIEPKNVHQAISKKLSVHSFINFSFFLKTFP